MAQISSFIRWAGGKSWLVPYIHQLIEGLEFNNYHEPFMGGASVFFSLTNLNKSFLSDINEELINAFSCVRDNPQRVIAYLSNYTNDERSYYLIRNSKPMGRYQKAARFLYLNAFSYNGLYRVNKQGKYNVPYGYRKNISIDYDRIIAASEKLKNTILLNQDFDKAKEYIKKKDLVFLDPPYVVPKESSDIFIEYNPKLFSLEDQYRLADLIDWINSKGAFYIMTNADNQKIYSIFKDKGNMIKRDRNSLIGGKNAFRGKVSEYIFTNISKRDY